MIFDIYLEYFVYIFVFSLLIVVSVIDSKTKTISNKLVFLIFIVSLMYKLYIGLIFDSMLGLLTGFSIFFFIAVVSRGGMGGGDIKLVSAIGVLLGFEKTLSMISFAFILAGIVAVLLLITKVKSRKDSLPFAPFIAISTFITLLGVL